MLGKLLNNMVGPFILILLGVTLIIINHFGQTPDRCEARMSGTPVAPVYPGAVLVQEKVIEDTPNTAIREYVYEVIASSTDLVAFFRSPRVASCPQWRGDNTCRGYADPFGDYEMRFPANEPIVSNHTVLVMWDRWYCNDLTSGDMLPFSVEQRDPTEDNLVIALSNLCGMLVIVSAGIWALVRWYRGRTIYD